MGAVVVEASSIGHWGVAARRGMAGGCGGRRGCHARVREGGCPAREERSENHAGASECVYLREKGYAEGEWK